MYPRNATTPPRIAIGAVVQISDGAVQSSGVSVAVRAEAGSEAAGGGTVSYGGSSNVVYYAPTQAETDYTAFAVVAYKTGCIPVSQTIITTDSASIPTATQNADALLNRDMSAVSDTNARSPLNALRFIRNKWDVVGTTLTVKKEDDTTTAWTAAVTASPGADPISGNDPT